MKKAIKPKKTSTMSAGSRKIFEHTNFGKEPVFPEGHELTKMELIHAYNWYNYMLDRSDAVTYIKHYLSKRYPQLKEALSRTECQHILTSYCWAARIIDNGNRLPGGTEARLLEHVQYVISRYPVERNVGSLVDRTREKVISAIADIEGMLDSSEPFSVYDYLSKNAVPKTYVEKVVEYYTPILVELESVSTTKDKQLKEAYAHLNAKALKLLIATYQSIIADCDRMMENKKVVRKPRQKKVVSIEKKTSKVKYLEKFDPYQILSKPPSAIVGSKEVWLYNAKYKTVTKLVSATGFDIAGTTITNIDLALSQKKTTGRSSKEVVDQILKAGKVQLRKVMDNIKGVSSEASGRINKDVLILRT